MLNNFFLISKDTFLTFVLIPLSSGSYYTLGTIFFGEIMPYVAKIMGISLALTFNFMLGFLLRLIAKKKKFRKPPKAIFLLLLLSPLPVISGVVSFYFGLLKSNFMKFISIAFIINAIYYGLAIWFPVLDISI